MLAAGALEEELEIRSLSQQVYDLYKKRLIIIERRYSISDDR
jgi:hypothetical protein